MSTVKDLSVLYVDKKAGEKTGTLIDSKGDLQLIIKSKKLIGKGKLKFIKDIFRYFINDTNEVLLLINSLMLFSRIYVAMVEE